MAMVRKKRVSKKNKASWRKHVDIKDIEDFLEEKRLDERIGRFAEKKDEELFIVDRVASNKLLTVKQKRKINAGKLPKNCAVLENSSKVEDPIIRRNIVKLKRNGRNRTAEMINPQKSRRVLQSIKDRAKSYERFTELQNRIKSRRIANSDIWEEEILPNRELLKNEWISRELALHNLKNLGKPLVKRHDSANAKTSAAKAIEAPHPGISYNPSLKDHQDLIQKVIEREEKIIKIEEHLKRITTDMFTKVTEEEKHEAELSEMTSGLNAECESKPQDSDDNLEEEGMCNPVKTVQNKKKSKKARRKQREQRELLRKLKEKKEQKKKITDIHRIKQITENIIKDKEQLQKLRESRQVRREKKKTEPKRISKLKYEEPEIDVSLAEDLSGNLRNIRIESSLLIDRFKNYQKRNVLPVSNDLGSRKRRKIKRFVRKSHKETPYSSLLMNDSQNFY